jgi:carbamate kinase
MTVVEDVPRLAPCGSLSHPAENVELKHQETHRRGFTVVGVGGGGIPVIEDSKGELVGVEAVIDKISVPPFLPTLSTLTCL